MLPTLPPPSGGAAECPGGPLNVSRNHSGTFSCTSMPQKVTLSTMVSFVPPSLST